MGVGGGGVKKRFSRAGDDESEYSRGDAAVRYGAGDGVPGEKGEVERATGGVGGGTGDGGRGTDAGRVFVRMGTGNRSTVVQRFGGRSGHSKSRTDVAVERVEFRVCGSGAAGGGSPPWSAVAMADAERSGSIGELSGRDRAGGLPVRYAAALSSLELHGSSAANGDGVRVAGERAAGGGAERGWAEVGGGWGDDDGDRAGAGVAAGGSGGVKQFHIPAAARRPVGEPQPGSAERD